MDILIMEVLLRSLRFIAIYSMKPCSDILLAGKTVVYLCHESTNGGRIQDGRNLTLTHGDAPPLGLEGLRPHQPAAPLPWNKSAMPHRLKEAEAQSNLEIL